MSETIRLRSGSAAAEIGLLGAELRSWSVADRPLIWTPLSTIWADTAPILFPVVGWTRGGSIRVDGQTYPLGLHGFARIMPFRLAAHGMDWARLVLESSKDSRTLYPFDFSLSVTYRLTADALRTELAVHNTGAVAMPYACGLHPGFCWPFAGGAPDDYAIEFSCDEDPNVPVISAVGLFTPHRRDVPRWTSYRLVGDAARPEALCFLDVKSRNLRFVHRARASIMVTLEDFPHIALWSRSGGGFLSIEAWTGYGDTENSDGDIWTKPSMIRLEPGSMRRHAATYVFASE